MNSKLLIASFLALVIPVGAQAEAPPAQVKELVEAYNKAWKQSDKAIFERILSDKYSLVSFDGEESDKAKVIKEAEEGKFKLELGESSNEKFREFGNTIVWTGTWHEKGTNDGKPVENKGPFTTVLVKEDGAWKVASDQVTRLVAKTEPDLTGAWKLYGRVDENGKVKKVNVAKTKQRSLKFLSNGEWCISFTDSDTGQIIFHHGGTYTVDGNVYTEAIEYAHESSENMIGNKLKFKVEVEGDTLTQTGLNNPYNEVWVREKPKNRK